jgi:hypothetical protein
LQRADDERAPTRGANRSTRGDAEKEELMHTVSIGRPATASIVVLGLWTVQVLLAALFAFSGTFKLITPIEQMPMPFALPGVFIRFIGVCEVLGALGLVLPGLLRTRTGLTPLAAGGLVALMIGAVMFTPPDGLALALLPLVVGLLAAIVAYGRWRVAPL